MTRTTEAMMGDIAFCPKTGAQLSKNRYYDEYGKALRVPVADSFVAAEELDGELTTGEVRSSRRALHPLPSHPPVSLTGE